MKTPADKERNRQRKAEWYQENRAKQYERVKRNQQRIRDYINEIREQSSCKECDENHPAVLDFHHREPSTKLAEVTALPGKGWSLDRVKAEIDKCDILCSNCHRKLHYNLRMVQSVKTPL